MSLTPKYKHENLLDQEFRRIYSFLDKDTDALTRLLVRLSSARHFHQWLSGTCSVGATTKRVLFGEAAYQASTVRLYAIERDGLSSESSHAVTVYNLTESTFESGALDTWTLGRAQADIDLDLNEGDEMAIEVVGHATMSFNINVGLTPASDILLDMDDYPAEFRTEED